MVTFRNAVIVVVIFLIGGTTGTAVLHYLGWFGWGIYVSALCLLGIALIKIAGGK